ncbi:MAG: fatty acid desaturase [Pleurocapsa sp. MO_226.B13]|nr:fatty acid desaturase [Pleurocapsa sp. MO_226.B13]
MSIDSLWHIERSQKILRQYPEIKQYFGNYPPSVLAIAFLVSLQWFVAWLVRDLSWWQVGVIAFLVGQFILHSLGVFVHEAAHNLIFKSKLGSNLALFLIVCGSLSFGESLTYIAVHGKTHHLQLNDYQYDHELWDRNLVEFANNHLAWRILESLVQLLPGGVIITDAIVSLLFKADSRQVKSAQISTSFNILLTLTSLSLYILAWFAISPQASLYLFWSLTLMASNWGITFRGQSIAEHHIYQQGKTFSTYSWTNIPFFNTGYHDEHHTFPQVAWIHLPKIKKIAPEYFKNNNPYSYFQWWWWWAKSIFTPVRYNRYFP